MSDEGNFSTLNDFVDSDKVFYATEILKQEKKLVK